MFKIALITASFLSSMSALGTPAHESDYPMGLELSVLGTGLAVEEHAVTTTRALLAKAYADGLIDQLTTYGYGIEGGMALCVSRTPFASGKAFLELKAAFDAIPVDPTRTAKSAVFGTGCKPRS